MAHSKHTAGPWRIDPCWDILGNTTDGNGLVCQITVDAVPYDEAQANARLIAAAPELLAEAIELLRNAEYADGVATVLTQDCEALQAAIARAEGGAA